MRPKRAAQQKKINKPPESCSYLSLVYIGGALFISVPAAISQESIFAICRFSAKSSQLRFVGNSCNSERE